LVAASIGLEDSMVAPPGSEPLTSTMTIFIFPLASLSSSRDDVGLAQKFSLIPPSMQLNWQGWFYFSL
jgi:hypothetical protein